MTGELQLHSLGGDNCGLHTQCAAARQPAAVRSPAQLVTSLVAQVECAAVPSALSFLSRAGEARLLSLALILT